MQPRSVLANPAILSATIASLFPGDVMAAELRAPGDASLLMPEEAAGVLNAVPKRIQEFAAGRLCARRALAKHGVINFPIRVAHDRQPLWPEFLVGSITHTVGLCAAAVAARAHVIALGLDSEAVGAVKVHLWPSICAAAELAWVDALLPEEQAKAVAMIFSAKEAFYKCQYPLAGERLNFHDVCVRPLEWGAVQGAFAVAPARPIGFFNRFAAPLRAPTSAPGSVLGSYRFHEQFVSAGIILPAPQESGV
ncbi:MAG: 4'-phosphopantetheinyl transferase family protein [Steroidobacteraceae bacterium]